MSRARQKPAWRSPAKDERELPYDRLNLSTPGNHRRNDPDCRPLVYLDFVSPISPLIVARDEPTRDRVLRNFGY